jgi:hypothetical protein
MKLFGKAICWGLSFAVIGMVAGYWGWWQGMAETYPGWGHDPNVPATMTLDVLGSLWLYGLKGFCLGLLCTYIQAWYKGPKSKQHEAERRNQESK